MNPYIYDELYRNTPDRWAGDFEIDKQIGTVIYDLYGDKDIDILDMGCGIGRTIKVINKKNMDIVGMDFSDEGLKIAGENNPNIKFMNCDMTKTPFDTNSFDIVLSVGSHEHLEKIDFSEPHRLTKEYFICVLPVSGTNEGWVDVSGQTEWKLTRLKWMDILSECGFLFYNHVLNSGDLFICKII